MAELIKLIGRRPAVQRALAGAAAGLMRLVNASTRWQTINGAVAQPAWAGERPVIVAFWHNRLAMMPFCWPSSHPFHMLISAHPDGRLIANAVAHFGISTVSGSSHRGGSDALRALVRLARSGASVGITPDGPRGPRMRASEGAVTLARLAGVPILPAAVSVSRRLVLSSWDRLVIPLPFGHGATVWGEPITVARDAPAAEMARLREALECALNEVTARADGLAGHRAMEPGPADHALDSDAAA